MKNIIKFVIVASAFLGTTNVALAQPRTACQVVESLSRVIMEVRQVGASLGDVMAIANSPPLPGMAMDAVAAQQKLMKELVLEAFEVPRFNTKENQQKAAVDFSNKAALACHRAK